MFTGCLAPRLESVLAKWVENHMNAFQFWKAKLSFSQIRQVSLHVPVVPTPVFSRLSLPGVPDWYLAWLLIRTGMFPHWLLPGSWRGSLLHPCCLGWHTGLCCHPPSCRNCPTVREAVYSLPHGTSTICPFLRRTSEEWISGNEKSR